MFDFGDVTKVEIIFLWSAKVTFAVDLVVYQVLANIQNSQRNEMRNVC